MNTIADEIREVEVEQFDGDEGCAGTETCRKYISQFRERMIGRYVGMPGGPPPPITAAVLDVRGIDYEAYMASLRKIHKGAAVRQSRKCDRAGFVCERFAWRNHVPDVVDINRSMEVRSGGEMRDAYRRSVEEMGGAPSRWQEPTTPECLLHGMWNWGVFEPRPGHRQGEVVMDRRLLAYVRFKRQGSLGIYTQILGHGDHLGEGIMFRLHYAIMEWIAANPEEVPGLTHILYGAISDGNDGLKMWKKRCGFEPARLVLSSRSAERIASDRLSEESR